MGFLSPAIGSGSRGATIKIAARERVKRGVSYA
jgi:hypothetical protein